MHFGLIGKSLKHSFSERYFNVLFKKQGLINYKYSLYEIDNIEKIRSIFDHDSLLKGVNVTIPYKSSVIPFLDELSPVGHSIKAINCILNQNHKKCNLAKVLYISRTKYVFLLFILLYHIYITRLSSF